MPTQSQPAPQPARSLAWGLLSGAVGGLCCLGPASAALLGLSASSALAALHIHRATAAALALALLAAGVGLALRRGARCALRPAQRLRAPLLMLAAFGLSYALLAWLLPNIAAERVAGAPIVAARPVSPAPAAELRRLTLSIEQMDCPPCVAHIRRRLAEQAGVAAFVAEPGADIVLIDYRPGQVSAADIAAIFPISYGVTALGDEAIPGVFP